MTDPEFERLLRQHRAEIQLHCYRMVGSLEDAEDLAQESSLRAWQAYDRFAWRAGFRTWLYRIATNACLDHLRTQARRRRPVVAASQFATVPAQVAVPWLQPYPTAPAHLQASAEESSGHRIGASSEPDPAQVVVSRDTVRLAFVAAVQYLPPKQRGAFLLRDCLGWSVAECADALASSAAAVNSALQRARATLRTVLHQDPDRWTADEALDPKERGLVTRYIEAVESADDGKISALLAEDVRVSHAGGAGGNAAEGISWYAGRSAVIAAWHPVLHADGHPDLLMVPVPMNGRVGVASYVRAPGEESYRAFALNALTVSDGKLVEVATFPTHLFDRFEVPDHGTEAQLRRPVPTS